jgi:hypothetical protein
VEQQTLAKKTILILAANPKSTEHLRLDQEVRDIENGLQQAEHRDEFVLKSQWAVRPVDVRRAMLKYKPNIVHFSGHGEGEAGIAFEDDAGQAKLVTAPALASLFKLFADNVECVLLNACYSQVQAQAIAKHIDSVIGMNKAIQYEAALEFVVAFYDALGAGESIKFAYEMGCSAIQMAGIEGEHLIPVLIQKKKKSKRKTPVQTTIQNELSFSRSHALRGNAGSDAPRPASANYPPDSPMLLFSLQDAERPSLHSHAERGNEKQFQGFGKSAERNSRNNERIFGKSAERNSRNNEI